MSTYAIGDLQGCRDALQRLLERLRFDPGNDCLWLTGDLVNRGPDSVGTLRLVRELGPAATVVLGNHDLHLLAVAAGGPHGRNDTFNDVLRAPDAAELLDWLAHRPLMQRDTGLGWSMIHAGLPPQWSIEQAESLAREAESILRSSRRGDLLLHMYGNDPLQWHDGLTGIERHRFIVNCFTRLRYCDAQGRLLLRFKGAPDNRPANAIPWFLAPNRRNVGERIVFGHWSMLGRVQWPDAAVWGIDTGCLWGGRLTALCLETTELTSCDCPTYRNHN